MTEASAPNPAAKPRGSVVIPAHNEQRVIAECLAPLAELAAAGTLEIVVVCNGCIDATAQVAKGFAQVTVLELPVGAKPAAIRAGEAATTVTPRIYLDADVVLSAEAALAVIDRLTPPETPTGWAPLAARPPLRYETTGASALVRRYYRARSSMPAVLTSLWGAGVYAVSAAGRQRFAEFPDAVADDLWIDQQYHPGEIEIVDCAPVVVRVPRTARDLVRVLSRAYRGKAEHHRDERDDARQTVWATLADLRRLPARGFSAMVDSGVYTGFAVAGRLARLERLLRRGGSTAGWERDDSSRAAVGP